MGEDVRERVRRHRERLRAAQELAAKSLPPETGTESPAQRAARRERIMREARESMSKMQEERRAADQLKNHARVAYMHFTTAISIENQYFSRGSYDRERDLLHKTVLKELKRLGKIGEK